MMPNVITLQPKVFISHKQEDSVSARFVRNELLKYKVDAYLDLLDQDMDDDAKKLTEHLKRQMNKCSDLLVVMSRKTHKSWWVPFEIGMAAHKDLPTVTYLKEFVDVPEYLSFWPYLKDDSEVGLYARDVKRRFNGELQESATAASESFSIDSYSRLRSSRTTSAFYESLGRSLSLHRIAEKNAR